MNATNHHTSNKRDDIPQRPFRRLSVASRRCLHLDQLWAVHEDSGDEDASEAQGWNKGSHDYAPRKPKQCDDHYDDTSTTLFDSTTIFTFEQTQPLEERLYREDATEEVKAREQPNLKTSATLPIGEGSDPSLWERKRVVEEFWRCMNERDLQGLRRICAADWKVEFRGADPSLQMEMGMDEFVHKVSAVFRSLPNMRFMHRTIEESQAQRGALVLDAFVGVGNHTGEPFALASLPPIEATGKLVVLDECEQHYFFEPGTNKMSGYEEIALGEKTGIFGVYAILSQP